MNCARVPIESKKFILCISRHTASSKRLFCVRVWSPLWREKAARFRRKRLDVSRADRYSRVISGNDRRMDKALQRIALVSLAICPLLLSSVAAVKAVEHSVQHEHHQAAAHATILCSWMCTAGQAVESPPVGPQLYAMLLELVEPLLCQELLNHDAVAFPSRSPPWYAV